MRFVDTNVLLYAASTAEEDEAKAQVARAILDETDVALSTQTHHQAASLVDACLRFPVQAITTPLVLAALETRERHQLSYWDAAILEAARATGCSVVLSEDLSHGQDYDGIEVENPFLGL